ncbi:hypothetical protein [Thalassospira mesophila]|nr:hypothetical protein [Thalassospira mesophila]
MSENFAQFQDRINYLEATDPVSMALGTLYLEGASILDTQDRQGALHFYDRAEDIFRKHQQGGNSALSGEQPPLHSRHAKSALALCLNNRAALLVDMAQWDAARRAASEAVTLRRDLLNADWSQSKTPVQDPALYKSLRADLVYSLGALARAHAGEGNFPAALATCHDALMLLRPVADDKTDPAFGLLGKMTAFYSQVCALAGQKPDPALLFPLLQGLAAQKRTPE